ncbi:GntR family transcriptional regulator [Haloferula rosea]|uniref:GntR family transcriptional regulator n=1 Tax=Haloferula rosea TaxID=490093 RepID=A0A934RE09_9BACT|nr:GntR family transcriptional regulator [Haloferula rosea]MBK1829043.1 GntR family transcriptional regulator [Haloferula rosea]
MSFESWRVLDGCVCVAPPCHHTRSDVRPIFLCAGSNVSVFIIGLPDLPGWGALALVFSNCIMPIKRQSTPRLVADQLKSEIEHGSRTTFLPGQQKLAKELGVSVPSVRGAIRFLVDEGYLEVPKKGQKIRIRSNQGDRISPASNLLLISPKRERLSELSFELLAGIEERWREHFPKSNVISVQRTERPMSHDELAQEISVNHVRGVVAFEALEGWSEQLNQIDLPVYRLAGAPIAPKLGESGWGVSIEQVISSILGHLHGLGHRRILTPILRPNLRESILGAYAASAVGVAFDGEEMVPLFPLDDEPRFRAFWERALTRFQPTAVVCIYTPVLFSLYGFCQVAGLRIPSHLSAVTIEHHQLVRFLMPRIAAPIVRGEGIRDVVNARLKLFDKWLKDGLQPQGYKLMGREFDWGESIRDIR